MKQELRRDVGPDSEGLQKLPFLLILRHKNRTKQRYSALSFLLPSILRPTYHEKPFRPHTPSLARWEDSRQCMGFRSQNAAGGMAAHPSLHVPFDELRDTKVQMRCNKKKKQILVGFSSMTGEPVFLSSKGRKTTFGGVAPSRINQPMFIDSSWSKTYGLVDLSGHQVG